MEKNIIANIINNTKKVMGTNDIKRINAHINFDEPVLATTDGKTIKIIDDTAAFNAAEDARIEEAMPKHGFNYAKYFHA